MQIRVSYQEMLQASNVLREYASSYEKCYQSMYEDIRSIASVWKGEDHSAYVDSIEGFEVNFAKMKDLLFQISEFVKDASNQFSSAQELIRAQAQGLSRY